MYLIKQYICLFTNYLHYQSSPSTSSSKSKGSNTPSSSSIYIQTYTLIIVPHNWREQAPHFFLHLDSP